jgi:Tol biopolymer transport system component
VLAFQRGQGATGVTLEIVDRKGNTTTKTPVSGTLGNPRFSPDAHRLLYERKGPGGTPWGDVSVYDLERGTDTPLSFTGGAAVRAVWSPDGRRIAYTRISPGAPAKLMIGSSDGLGAPDSIAVPVTFYLTQWSAAGDRLVGFTDTGHAVIVNAAGPDRTVRSLVDSTQIFVHAAISPDGRRLAGVTGTPGSFHVFVQTLEGPPGRWQISSGANASDPHWTKGGRELVYESADGRIMAVDIDTREGFHAGVPHELYTLATPSSSSIIRSWIVDDTGERFTVLKTPRVSGAGRTIELVTDLRALVERK